jgi:hypothetical protein
MSKTLIAGAAMLVMVLAGAAGAGAFPAAEAGCCRPGEECCFSGSPCCGKSCRYEGSPCCEPDHECCGSLQTTEKGQPDCCRPSSECCSPGSPCCD